MDQNSAPMHSIHMIQGAAQPRLVILLFTFFLKGTSRGIV